MRFRRSVFLSLMLLLLLAGISGKSQAQSTSGAQQLLVTIADVSLPGGTSRFDYQSIDPTSGRLFISHMGDGVLVVFDTKTTKVVTQLAGFPTVTGVLAVPALRRVYASVTKNHEIAVVEADTLQVLIRIPDGDFPDGIAYSPETGKLFVSDESGGVDTVIDARTNQKRNAIQMGGEVGNTQYDANGHLVYACVQTRNELVAIDPVMESIKARYPLKDADHPHGFYIDDQHNKAYISCQGNNRLLVFDLKTHLVEDVFPIGEDPDVLAYDRSLNLLYVACEGGVVSVFRTNGGKLQKLGDAAVGPNCHTVSVDQASHLVYFPLKNVNGRPVLRIMKAAVCNP